MQQFDLGLNLSTKKTRKHEFLKQMQQVVPWQELVDLIALHKNATTTPATRLALQHANGTDRELAKQYGTGIGTRRKWRNRTTVYDALKLMAEKDIGALLVQEHHF